MSGDHAIEVSFFLFFCSFYLGGGKLFHSYMERRDKEGKKVKHKEKKNLKIALFGHILGK